MHDLQDVVHVFAALLAHDELSLIADASSCSPCSQLILVLLCEPTRSPWLPSANSRDSTARHVDTTCRVWFVEFLQHFGDKLAAGLSQPNLVYGPLEACSIAKKTSKKRQENVKKTSPKLPSRPMTSGHGRYPAQRARCRHGAMQQPKQHRDG